MGKGKMKVMFLVLAVVIVGVDQWVKLWIQQNLPLHSTKAFLPGLVELTYVQNKGAAFSMLASYTWLLALVSAIAAVVILIALLRDSFPHRLGQLALALILGGAVGNLIDRLRFGFVVDMFSLEFMNFAIFNVADIGVTIGGVLLCVYVLFYWNKEKEAKA